MRSNWSQMEAFSFEKPLAEYEQHAATPGMLALRHDFPMLLFLGQARMGAGKFAEAWEALEKLHMAISEGGFPFQLVCPLKNLRAECAIAQNQFQQGRELAQHLLQLATEHHEWSYLARGHRLLAELDLREGNAASARQHVLQAQMALQECEAWNVEWRVYATAARVLAQLDRPAESAAARERRCASRTGWPLPWRASPAAGVIPGRGCPGVAGGADDVRLTPRASPSSSSRVTHKTEVIRSNRIVSRWPTMRMLCAQTPLVSDKQGNNRGGIVALVGLTV